MSFLIPGYAQGFAHSAAEAEEPRWWDKLGALYVPVLGMTGQNTLVDWSGRRQDATLQTGALWGETERLPGWPNIFTAAGGIVLPKPLISDTTKAFTVAMSFYRSASASGNRLFDQQTTRIVFWVEGPYNATTLKTYIGGTTLNADTVVMPLWGYPHHAVWSETRDPDTQRVWLNGEIVKDTTAARADWGVGAGTTKLGEDSLGETERLWGGIFFFAYYNRAWTDIEAYEFCQDPYRMLKPIRRVAELQLVPPTVRPWWYYQLNARRRSY